MFIDCRELDDGTVIETDVAIIGAGMAGICLAAELRSSKTSVCLLESGGTQPDEATDDLSRGTAIVCGANGRQQRIDEYLRQSRSRYHGGTGNEWGGKCARLDPFDLSERAWIGDSGWPFGYDELQPCYQRASALLRIPNLDSCRKLPAYRNGRCVRMNAGHNFETDFRCHTSLTGKPASAAFEAYKNGVASRARVYLHAHLSELIVSSSGSRIEQGIVNCIDGRKHTVRAKVYVLAAGGIENARILLSSSGVLRSGVGNGNDLVGRYFNGHAIFRYLHGWKEEPCLLLKNPSAPDLGFYAHEDRSRIEGFFRITPKAQWRERIANFAVMLEPPADASGEAYPVFFTCEQVPNRESRITLSEEQDSMGLRRACLHWRFSPQDQETLQKGIGLFAAEVARSGIGRLTQAQLRGDLTEIMEGSRHHMGTTRMHASPRKGVVDPDAKVHGIDNLYVAGSSIFPTGGVANPTLTILALTLRLADHLKRKGLQTCSN